MRGLGRGRPGKEGGKGAKEMEVKRRGQGGWGDVGEGGRLQGETRGGHDWTHTRNMVTYVITDVTLIFKFFPAIFT